MEHKVDDLASNILHESKDIKKCLADMQSDADKQSCVYCLYHNPHDERYALNEAITAQKNNKFVNFDNDVAASLLSNRVKNKLSPTQNKTKKTLFGSGICSGLFTALLTVVLSIVEDQQRKIALACVLAGLLLVCAAVILFVWLSDKRRNVASELCADDLKKLDVGNLTPKDFCYSAAKNRIFVVDEPTDGTQDNFLWQFFNSFIRCKSPKAKFGVLLLKTVRYNVGNKHASEVLSETYQQEVKKWKASHFDTVKGGYLVPLTDLEKIKLVEELGLGNKIPNGFLSYGGRDFFYGFEDNGGVNSDDYNKMVESVRENIAQELSLEKLPPEGVRQALSFLAALQLFLGANRVDNVSDVLNLPSNECVNVYNEFAEILQLSAQGVDICKQILQIIWANNVLTRVVKREYALLTSLSSESDKLCMPSYQKAVMCAIGFLKYKNGNFFIYEDMEADINAFLDKILYWYSVHTTLRFENVCNNWLDVFSYLLEINMACGYFARNCYLLRTVDELYAESLKVAENQKFKKFYLSATVQKAYEVNSLVCPHCAENGNAVDAQKMHLEYLENIVAMNNGDSAEETQTQAPQYFPFACKMGFELLPATDAATNLQRYYDLIVESKHTRLLDVYRAIYERCLKICNNRVLLRCFSEHYDGKELASAIESALEPTSNSSHLSNILYGDKDIRLLACGFADCDLFYLAYDLEQGEDALVFDKEIDNPSYRFAARLAFVEKNNQIFSNVFNEMVDDVVLRAHNQFAEKYLFDRMNYSMYDGTHNKIVKYLAQSNLALDYENAQLLSEQETTQLINILYGVSSSLPDSNLLKAVPHVKCVPEVGKTLQYFVDIVLNKQPVAEVDKQQFVEDLTKAPADVVFVLFVSACELDGSLLSAIPQLAAQLLRSDYTRSCTFILDNFDCVAEDEKENLRFQVEKCITRQIALGILPKDMSALRKYVNFMSARGRNVSTLEMTIMKLYAQISEMERESLRRDVGYLLHYAYNMINAVSAVTNMGFVPQPDAEPSTEELAANRQNLELLIRKDNIFGLNKNFIRLIVAILGAEVTLTDKDMAEFHKQTLENLIKFFELDYVRSKIVKIDVHTTTLKQMLKNTVRAK